MKEFDPRNEFDAIVVGSGPAGSSCARFLTSSGKRVAIVDRASFPRVKLCAGWLSSPVWTALDIDPAEYEQGREQDLWRWDTCHVHVGERCHQVPVSGYFIRRYQFDNYLRRISGAEPIETNVKRIERRDGCWVINDEIRAPYLVGAAGTHCPVSRHLFGKRLHKPAGARELELQGDADAIAKNRAGLDGEPELYLHPDLRGYSWNIPKTDWLNVGSGTIAAKDVRSAWEDAKAVFARAGHLPPGSNEALDAMKGHSYYLFDPGHLAYAEKDGALLIGDALGLAHPLTAEGIYPAILSARLAAEAIADDDPSSYRQAMLKHPLFREYTALWQLRDTGGALRPSSSDDSPRPASQGNQPGLVASWLLARGFAWMFAGKPVPGNRLVKSLMSVVRRWDRFVSPATLAQAQARREKE